MIIIANATKYGTGALINPVGKLDDEVFEVITLIQTKKIDKVPVVFVGTEYWKGLLDWVKSTMLLKEKNINPEDLKLFEVTDDPNRIVKIINNFYKKKELKPNYRL